MQSIVITPEEIKKWSSYAIQRTFASEQEARDWIFRQMQQGQINNMGPEYNRTYADQFPIYPFGRGQTAWKVGKPVRKPREVFRLKDIQVRKPSKTTLYQIGQSLTADPFELGPLEWVPIQELLGDDQSVYSGQEQEVARIKDLADQIKENKWLEAVVIGQEANGERYVIEGQHRVRAMRLLGFNQVPTIAIIESPAAPAVQAWVRANCKFGQADQIPALPGTSQIPAGTVRRFHVTDKANISSILREGLTMNKAKGIEGPRAIYSWVSYREAENYGVESPIVEFWMPANAYNDNPYATYMETPPEQIIAIHEPWHGYYRYALENNLDPENLRGINEDYDKAADALERNKNHP